MIDVQNLSSIWNVGKIEGNLPRRIDFFRLDGIEFSLAKHHLFRTAWRLDHYHRFDCIGQSSSRTAMHWHFDPP